MPEQSSLPAKATGGAPGGLVWAAPIVWPVRPAILAGAVGVFAAIWLTFVFTGSLLTYLASVVVAVGIAGTLGLRGHWFALLAVTVVATLVGTEARGDLGTSVSGLGGVRLLDYVIFAAAVGALVHLWRTGAGLSVATARAWLQRWWLPLALLAVLLALWAANGAPLDPQTNTDARLVLIVAGTLVIARITLPGHEREFLVAIAALTILLAAKAIALHLSTLWTIGTSDRAQAAQVQGPPAKRTILVGGDTLFVVAPAIAAGYAQRLHGRFGDRLLAAAAVACLIGVLLSGTRTSLIVVVATAIAGALVNLGPKILRVSPRTLAIVGLTSFVVLAAGAVVSGTAERFAQGDNAHNGLNFRRDEIASVQRLPTADFVVGQGLGGRFLSKDSAGNLIETPWSHVIAIWVVLKIGVIGLIAALVGALYLLVRFARAGPALDQRITMVVLTSLILLSLLVGRAALPEGVIIAISCFVMLGWGSAASSPSKVSR